MRPRFTNSARQKILFCNQYSHVTRRKRKHAATKPCRSRLSAMTITRRRAAPSSRGAFPARCLGGRSFRVCVATSVFRQGTDLSVPQMRCAAPSSRGAFTASFCLQPAQESLQVGRPGGSKPCRSRLSAATKSRRDSASLLRRLYHEVFKRLGPVSVWQQSLVFCLSFSF